MSSQVILDNTEFWKIDSKITCSTYDIKVSLPNEEPPENGFPIYYLLDGNFYFQFGRDVVRLQARNTPKTFIAPAIVVGIGHPGDNEAVTKRRFYDFTPPAAEYIYPERLRGKNIGVHGGAENFLNFIEQELMPVVEEKYKVDQEKQALFGHSLSGLFVLWALFTRSGLFQYYLASSPSIWWNDHELYKYAKDFYNCAVVDKRRKVLITVGSEEAFMVDDAQELYSMMSLHQVKQFELDLYVAPNENHASVVPTIMSRAFRTMWVEKQ